MSDKQVTGLEECGINRLPKEVILYILSLLPKESLKTVALVNKKFNHLSQQRTLDKAYSRL